jgi:hypothetical protein
VKYPVNHHHAQILERALIAGALRWRRGGMEYSWFNGDEPESTSDWPNRGRAFDSWSARATVWPTQWLELAASYADVQSPEFATGEGLDQRKQSIAAKLERPANALRYALVEMARTSEYSGDRRAFLFRSFLAEAEWMVRGNAVSLRVERTERPEEERALSLYRTVRPLLDFNILGRSRWTTATLHLERSMPARGWWRWAPFAEVSASEPRATLRPTALDPVDLFGSSRLWMYSAGVRAHLGWPRMRLGRYGAAIVRPVPTPSASASAS